MTGMMCKIEQLHVHEMSQEVTLSSKQIPVALWQRCERRVAGALKPVCFFPLSFHVSRTNIG
jgi:hypothetical protein